MSSINRRINNLEIAMQPGHKPRIIVIEEYEGTITEGGVTIPISEWPRIEAELRPEDYVIRVQYVDGLVADDEDELSDEA